MKLCRCKVENPLGIHARPAALLAQLCVGIRSTVTIKCNGKEANGNNVLQILALKASKGDILEITVEGDNNKVHIGDKVFVLDDTRMITVDGSTLHIGNECMFSDRIDIRTTDNHAIIDMDTSKRINFEENITIGDKVWIGTGVNILKGSLLPDGTIVGARSVVTKQYQQNNSVIVGNPARVVRNNVRWTMER